MISVPLSNPDLIQLNLQQVYDETYQLGRWGIYRDLVDYAQLPARFHTYSPADQERIHQRMAMIAEAHGRGEKFDDQ